MSKRDSSAVGEPCDGDEGPGAQTRRGRKKDGQGGREALTREQRLAEQLRENLKKRKVLARARRRSGAQD